MAPPDALQGRIRSPQTSHRLNRQHRPFQDLSKAETELKRFIFLKSPIALIGVGAGIGSLTEKLEGEVGKQLAKLATKANDEAGKILKKYDGEVANAFAALAKGGK